MPSCITARDKAPFSSVHFCNETLSLQSRQLSRDGASQQDPVMVCVHVRAQAEAQTSAEVLLASPVAK